IASIQSLCRVSGREAWAVTTHFHFSFTIYHRAVQRISIHSENRKAPLRIKLDLPERRYFDSASWIDSLTVSGGPAAAREIITDGEGQHDEQPEYARDDDHLCQARAPSHVHEDQDDRRRFDHGDGQRHDGVERSPGFLQIELSHVHRQPRHYQQ